MTHANDNVPRLISVNQVCQLTSLSRTAISKLRRQGTFPKDVCLGEKRIAFVRAEVLDWIDARIAARSAANDNSRSVYETRGFIEL